MTGLVQAETLDDVVRKLAKEKVAAVEKYLADNPKASDASEAVDHLVEGYLRLEDHKKVADLLQKKYDLELKAEKVDVQTVIGMIVPQRIESLRSAGDKEAAAAFVDQVLKDFKDHAQAAQIGEFLAQLKSMLAQPGVGDTMDIAFTSMNGRKVDLAKMKGKVVLVDFWATWCGPCLRELPTVKQVYKDYHEKGFEIVAISLDEDEAALKSFVAKEEMPWVQYYDGKGRHSDMVRKFGITGIPATFLIGKDGKIAASNLRGPALEAAVIEALK